MPLSDCGGEIWPTTLPCVGGSNAKTATHFLSFWRFDNGSLSY